ncbi:MAG: hypothetical protein IJK64_08300 [Clostridia bacterium]|nr:hypothetical protein [Clostridia bacterium]
MKTKAIVGVTLSAAALIGCLAGCSNVPKTPATTSVAQYSYVNEQGMTLPTPVNADPNAKTTVGYKSTVDTIDYELSSYYVYNNSVVEITDIEMEDEYTRNIGGYATVKINALGHSRKDGVRVAYKAYDADGKLVRDSFILIPLKDVKFSKDETRDAKVGDVITDRRFDFPRETVKIVFENYQAD